MIQAKMTWQQCSDENNGDNDANYVHGGNDSGNEDTNDVNVVNDCSSDDRKRDSM